MLAVIAGSDVVADLAVIIDTDRARGEALAERFGSTFSPDLAAARGCART